MMVFDRCPSYVRDRFRVHQNNNKQKKTNKKPQNQKQMIKTKNVFILLGRILG